MAIEATTTSGVANLATKTNNATASLAKDFNEFLTLLTTQLQNQDPLSPMDSNEFTNQLVQFSQVEQSINTNQKLDALVQMQLSNASSVGLGYVGMDVNYTSAEMSYDGQTPIDITYALSADPSQMTISIYDEEGYQVYSTKEETGIAGRNNFTWDGKTKDGAPLPAGTYSISVDAIDQAGEEIDTSTVVSGRVRGIESQNGIVYLLVGDRAVSLSSVINATVPKAAETPATGDESADTTESTTEEDTAA